MDRAGVQGVEPWSSGLESRMLAITLYSRLVVLMGFGPALYTFWKYRLCQLGYRTICKLLIIKWIHRDSNPISWVQIRRSCRWTNDPLGFSTLSITWNYENPKLKQSSYRGPWEAQTPDPLRAEQMLYSSELTARKVNWRWFLGLLHHSYRPSTISLCAPEGSRTLTDLTAHGILSPACTTSFITGAVVLTLELLLQAWASRVNRFTSQVRWWWWRDSNS